MIEAMSSQSRFTDEVLILGTETSKIGLTCRLVSRKLAQYFSVRSDLLSAQVALDEVLNGASNMQRRGTKQQWQVEYCRTILLRKAPSSITRLKTSSNKKAGRRAN